MGIENLYKPLSFLTYPFAKKRMRYFSAEESKTIWVHAASIGEVVSIIPVLKELEKENLEYVLTTMTSSGKKKAEAEGIKAKVFLFPFDNLIFIKRLLQRAKLVIFSESEFWPNTLIEIKKRKIKAFLINGRISEKSFKKWKAFKNFAKILLSAFEKFFVIGEKEKYFLEKLGVKNENIFISGNLKFLSLNKNAVPLFEKPPFITITFASLRSKEFRGAVDLIAEIVSKYKDVFFIIAVRHLKTLIILENLLKSKHLTYEKYSQNKGKLKKQKKILLLDTLGDLVRVFPISDVVIVGGTFAPYGGHNLLEPAPYRSCILFGPYTDNVKLMEKALLKYRGGMKVLDFEELKSKIESLLEKRELIREIGENAMVSSLKMKSLAEQGFRRIIREIKNALC